MDKFKKKIIHYNAPSLETFKLSLCLRISFSFPVSLFISFFFSPFHFIYYFLHVIFSFFFLLTSLSFVNIHCSLVMFQHRCVGVQLVQ